MKGISMFRVACAVAFALLTAGPSFAAEIVPDVVYGHKDGMALTFDVLKPDRPDGAAVIYMVSGGWVSRWSPPEQALRRWQPYLDRGFTVFIVRHGSSPKYLIPDIVADVRRAVRYIRFNAKSWNVDADRIGVHGASAGGHLSLMLGTASDVGDPAATEPFMKVSSRVASVVAYFPPTDLRGMTRGLEAGTTGRFPALNYEREKAPDYSPIVFVTPDDPPTLLIHGDADTLVNISHSQNIYKVLQDARVVSEFITIPGAGHGFQGADATRASAATLAWFEKTLLKGR
jgi:acetyl esterase/lipase